MFKIKNFDDWNEIDDYNKFGSGASEKVWLVNSKKNLKGLFKFPKIKDKEKNIITGEYWAEKLASEIGNLLGIKCANVDIGIYKGRFGSMSYNIIDDDEELIEGVTFIQNKYPLYNKKKLIDEYSQEKYSFQMIKNSVYDIDDILSMILFDSLIGNSDRHHSNWGYIRKSSNNEEGMISFCPLYDNGSSLCAYEDSENTNIYFKDKMKYNALIDSKSKSAIGWYNIRPIRHFELLKNIKNEFYEESINYVLNIKNKITIETIQNILDNFDDKIISKEMKKLILNFIIDRKNKILEIFDLRNE